MVDRNLIREFQVDDDDLDAQFATAIAEANEEGEEFEDYMDLVYTESDQDYDVNKIVTGKIIHIDGDDITVDIGYKSEGRVHLDEWSEEEPKPNVGDEIEVLLEEIEDDFGLILLSKSKADRIRDWERVTSKAGEGDKVTGKVLRKIKGGLLVDIGVNVFLPASQVDIRRPPSLDVYLEQDIDCVILKIDEVRRNIVVSRRKLIEDERAELKKKLLTELQDGQIRKGVVKNIADFGAFVDLGGIDGLLHITDMSWGRIGHPTEMVSINDELEVMILGVDREKEKIALGLKQKFPSPWDDVEQKYPVGTKVKGEVVNVMSYGAFVKLEDGIEGLVHISEMSWTKRINHPNELVSIGDEVEVVVLGINTQKQEISLGMKQTQPNPWDDVLDKYPVGKIVDGVVRNLTNYGAFIELEEGVDGLLHVSDMSWTKKVNHANELLKKGDEVKCEIISVDEERKRIALGMKQLNDDPWTDTIPQKFPPGSVVKGTVTKITNFGVFVELEDDLEGLLHVSELSEGEGDDPEDTVKVGDEIDVRVLRIDADDRKIGLSRKLDGPLPEMDMPSSSRVNREELRGGSGDSGGPLFTMPGADAGEGDADDESDD